MPITRTPIIDDDGTGTTGTVLDNAWKQELYNQIDAYVPNPAPTTLTNHGVVIGKGTAPIGATTPGTAGQILTSQGPSADPIFAAPPATFPTLAAHGVVIAAGASPPVATTPGTAGQVLTSGGPSADPAFASIGKTLVQAVSIIGGGDFTTTSTSDVDVTTMAVTLTTTGGEVLLLLTVPVQNASAQNAYFGMTKNGVNYTNVFGVMANTVLQCMTLFSRVTGLAPGTYTFQLRVRTSAGAQVSMPMSSFMAGTFIGMEFK